MGLSDGLAEGVWRWTDTTVIDTEAWYMNGPQGGISSNCAAIKYSWWDKRWRDFSCDNKFKFICMNTTGLYWQYLIPII